MILTCLDDVGQLITVEWLKKKIGFFDLVEKLLVGSGALSVLSLVVICTDLDADLDMYMLCVFGVFATIAFVLFLVAEVCTFIWGFEPKDLMAMPQSDCRIILEATEKYDEFRFLKERIANMDRKLTILESEFIKSQLKLLEAKFDEQACRSLYGVQP